MKIGRARVSRIDQDTQLQHDAPNSVGCDRIYEEKQSGAKKDRPDLQQCLKSLRAGERLVVWKLDRLRHSLQHLIDVVADLEQRQIDFLSLTENIDTTSPIGCAGRKGQRHAAGDAQRRSHQN